MCVTKRRRARVARAPRRARPRDQSRHTDCTTLDRGEISTRAVRVDAPRLFDPLNHGSGLDGSTALDGLDVARARRRMTRTRERRFVCPETARRTAGDRARASIGRRREKTDIRRWRASARARGARDDARRRARAPSTRRQNVARATVERRGVERRARATARRERERSTRSTRRSARASRRARGRRATNGDRIESRRRRAG